MSKENQQERRRLETRLHELTNEMSKAQDTLAELRQDINAPPVKKARIEGNDAGAGDDTFFTELNHHIKLVCENEFDFDGATNLREIQENYNHLKEQLSAGDVDLDERPTFEYQSVYCINDEWRSFPGNSLFLFTSITHSFFCR